MELCDEMRQGGRALKFKWKVWHCVWTTLMRIYLVMNLLHQITTTVTLFAMSGVFYLDVCICLAMWHHKLWCRGSHLRSVSKYHIFVFKVANATTDIFGAESNAFRRIDVAVFPLRGCISWWVTTKHQKDCDCHIPWKLQWCGLMGRANLTTD